MTAVARTLVTVWSYRGPVAEYIKLELNEHALGAREEQAKCFKDRVSLILAAFPKKSIL